MGSRGNVHFVLANDPGKSTPVQIIYFSFARSLLVLYSESVSASGCLFAAFNLVTRTVSNYDFFLRLNSTACEKNDDIFKSTSKISKRRKKRFFSRIATRYRLLSPGLLSVESIVKMADLQGNSVTQDALSVGQLELGGNPNALALRRPFDPVAHDLDASFRLTRFADLKG